VSSESSASPGEFRRYRRFVSWLVLGFVSLGSVFMLTSVGVTIYRRRHAVLLGSPVGSPATVADAQSCFDELSDVVDGLQKHLENTHRLLGHYDVAEIQRWAEAGGYWRGQWEAVGRRCRFERRRGLASWEEMFVLHERLRATEASFTKEILRFVKEQGPKLDQLRERLQHIGQDLSK
jgi:hypothetical protein